MSNYPVGAENDSNAPFNKKELQGENVGLFDYLENLEMPYEAKVQLRNFIVGFELSKTALKKLTENLRIESRDDYKLALNIQRLLLEPQIFIENE